MHLADGTITSVNTHPQSSTSHSQLNVAIRIWRALRDALKHYPHARVVSVSLYVQLIFRRLFYALAIADDRFSDCFGYLCRWNKLTNPNLAADKFGLRLNARQCRRNPYEHVPSLLECAPPPERPPA
jgi:hypothetical protein